MAVDDLAAGDAIAPSCEVIEVRVTELARLFNAIDPSPFHDKDLDANAEEFIVGWAREVPRDAPLALLVHLDGAPGGADDVGVLRYAVRSSARLLDRLAAMPVRIQYGRGGPSSRPGVALS